MVNKKSYSKEILKDHFNERIYFGPFSGLKIPENLYKILIITKIEYF